MLVHIVGPNLCNNFLCRQCFSLISCRLSQQRSKSHYETLKLKENCTQKEIKAAYIELSKKYHPDISKNKTDKNFLNISEAYNTLSKPESRRRYDSALQHPSSPYAERRRKYPEYERQQNPWEDPAYNRYHEWRYEDRYKHHPYRTANRIPNAYIVMTCIMISFLGFCLQFLAISHASVVRRDEMRKRSDAIAENLEYTERRATENGNQKQLDILKRKLSDR